MYNSLTRIQNTFGLFTTAAFVVALFVALSDLVAPRTPSGEIIPESYQVYVSPPPSPVSPHPLLQHHSSTKEPRERDNKN